MIKNDVVNFINESPTAFNAVDNLKKELVNNNFIELLEKEKFNLKKEINILLQEMILVLLLLRLVKMLIMIIVLK